MSNFFADVEDFLQYDSLISDLNQYEDLPDLGEACEKLFNFWGKESPQDVRSDSMLSSNDQQSEADETSSEDSSILEKDLEVSESEDEEEFEQDQPTDTVVEKLTSQLLEHPQTDRLLESIQKYAISKKIYQRICYFESRGIFADTKCLKSKVRFVIRNRPY